MATIVLPNSLVKRIRREAERLGVSLDELLVEKLTTGLDPKDKALEYVETAQELLGQARKELGKHDLRQASEKIWGAAALAIKAHSLAAKGRRLTSHREIWSYIDQIEKEIGPWARDAFNAANAMHTNFYEAWATRKHVEDALAKTERLVKAIRKAVQPNTKLETR